MRFVLVQPVEDLLLGLVTDGAGVVEDEAGVGLVLDLGVALGLEGADDFFRVVRVHLAAEGFDVEGLAHLSIISPVQELGRAGGATAEERGEFAHEGQECFA